MDSKENKPDMFCTYVNNDTLTNDQIITIYHDIDSFLQKENLKWNKYTKICNVLEKLAIILLLISCGVGIICGVLLHKIWYIVVLYALLGGASAILVIGGVVLFFKPILFSFRLCWKNKIKKTIEKENQRCLLETLFLDKNAPDSPQINKEIYLANKNKIKYNTLLKQYKVNLFEFTSTKHQLRIATLLNQAQKEWEWVSMALSVVAIVIGIAVTFIAIYFLLIILVVVMVLGMLFTSFSRNSNQRINNVKLIVSDPPTPNTPYIYYGSTNGNKKTESFESINQKHERLLKTHTELKKLLLLYIPEMESLYNNDEEINNEK